jgi:hypothetical protein
MDMELIPFPSCQMLFLLIALEAGTGLRFVGLGKVRPGFTC